MSDRAYVAYHEAAHAVLHNLLGRIVSVSIVEGDDRLGGVQVNRHSDFRMVKPASMQHRYEGRIMAAMAGEIAQKRFDPTSVYPEGAWADRQNVENYLNLLRPPTEKIRRTWQVLLHRRAQALVDQHWAGIQCIAALLLEKQTITGEEVREACYRAAISRHYGGPA